MKVLACGGFEQGADIIRNGATVYRVPACTHWDDDHVRVIDRNGTAIVQIERREYSGTRSFGTDEWRDIHTIGHVDEIEIREDHPRGCCCEDCLRFPIRETH